MTGSGPLRILCVTWHFVPRANAISYVTAKMVKALMDLGHDVRVLWADAPSQDAGRRDDSPAWAPLLGISEAVKSSSRGGWFGDMGRLARYGAREPWVAAVVRRACELSREKPFDLVYSVSAPRRSHVAGYWCARALGTRWAVSVDDPWEYYHAPEWEGPPVGGPGRWLSERWLRKTLAEADVVGFASARLAAMTARIAGSERVGDVVPLIGWSRPGELRAGRFDLVHAGHLGIGKRSPRTLLEGLRRFLDGRPEARSCASLTFIGPRAEETDRIAAELNIAEFVSATGRVSYEESLERLGRASVSVLVEAEMKEGIYLPSKFADYVTTGRPILALSPATGTVSDMLPDPGVLRVDPTDVDGAARAIEELYDAWRSGKIGERRPSDGLARNFDAPEVAGKFLTLVGDVLAR